MVTGVTVEGDILGELSFSDHCGPGIIGTTSRTDSGADTKPSEELEVERASEYRSMGRGGFAEVDPVWMCTSCF
jgi:hypothetical protein